MLSALERWSILSRRKDLNPYTVDLDNVLPDFSDSKFVASFSDPKIADFSDKYLIGYPQQRIHYQNLLLLIFLRHLFLNVSICPQL